MTIYEYMMSSKEVSKLKTMGLLKYKSMMYPALYGRYLIHANTMNKTNAVNQACRDMNCSIRVGFKAVKLMEQTI